MMVLKTKVSVFDKLVYYFGTEYRKVCMRCME